jgi:hypothetical protein
MVAESGKKRQKFDKRLKKKPCKSMTYRAISVPHLRELSNQEKEDLSLIFKLKLLIVKM